VLGPQASPPARAAKNQLRFYRVTERVLVELDTGRRDACGPSMIVPDAFTTSVSDEFCKRWHFI